MQNCLTVKDAIKKLEAYCAYQERCHKEVSEKLWSLSMSEPERDEVIVHLINNNYLNEERFARSFARGKHRIKKWGKTRIINELKFRNISSYNITAALKEISDEEYFDTFDTISLRNWESLTGPKLAKRKKCCDFLLRKGYDTALVYERVLELEKNS